MRKRIIALYFIILFFLSACAVVQDPKTSPQLYYPSANFSYGINSEIIQQAADEPTGATIEDILQNYLKGPADPNFTNPFPKGTSLLACTTEESHTTIALSDRFADLTGIELTIACVCLAKTTMALTSASTVTIICESQLLDGDQKITLTNDSILLVDTSTNLTAYATNSPKTEE